MISTAVKMAVNDLYNSELDLYRQTGLISSKIKRFVKTGSVTLTSGAGPLPSDFVREINFVTNTGKEGTILTQEEFQDRVTSYILGPDDDNSIGKIQDNQIIIEPEEYPSIDLDYFRAPVDFVYATTPDGDGRGETFDAGNSIDVEFDTTVSGEIIRRALLYLGAGTQNQEAVVIGMSDNPPSK
jgi:hypothetical protein